MVQIIGFDFAPQGSGVDPGFVCCLGDIAVVTFQSLEDVCLFKLLDYAGLGNFKGDVDIDVPGLGRSGGGMDILGEYDAVDGITGGGNARSFENIFQFPLPPSAGATLLPLFRC